MKKLVIEILFGKKSMFGGLIALAIISAIGLGCFCNKDKFGGITNTGSSSPTPAASASPSPSATKSYTKSDPSKNQVPSNDEVQDLVKKTLLDFNDSLQKEDFNSFYDTIAKYWQKQTSPEKMKAGFQSFIDGDADLSPIKSLSANFSKGPELTKSLGMKTLEVNGTYDTPRLPTTFELKYIVEKNEWKLISINVRTRVNK
jgi:hypothetical protein